MGDVKYWDGEDFTVLDSKNAKSVNGIKFRINEDILEYSNDGLTWSNQFANIDLTEELENLATKTELANKVDKVNGKQLSTNDYTTTEKNKLSGIQAGAQVNAVTSVNGQTGAITTPNTTYNAATTTTNGLMSSTDKTKLNQLNHTKAMTQAQYDALSTEEKNRTDVWYGIYEE